MIAVMPYHLSKTAHRARLSDSQCGMTLIELMVAMVIGVFLIGGMVTVFTGNVRTSGLSQETAQLQANARYGIEQMVKDVRAAGFRGCATGEAAINFATDEVGDTVLTTDSVTGALVNAGAWSPVTPPGYVAPATIGVPVAGTHALLFRYGLAPGAPLSANMTAANGSMSVVGSDAGVAEDDIALVGDCQTVDVFEVKSVTSITGGKSVSVEDALTRRYGPSARVMKLINAFYYIGDTGRSNSAGNAVRSLYLQTYPFNAANNPPLEMVEGVDQLQLAFGQRDGNTIQYLTPDHASFDPQNVVSVRVGMLSATHDAVLDQAGSRTYQLAGRKMIPVGADAIVGAGRYPSDRRLRVPFNITVSVRNRNLAN